MRSNLHRSCSRYALRCVHCEDFYDQMLCGTDPFPEFFRAKRYKIHQKFLTKSEFQFIMRNLPIVVPEPVIDEMFTVADDDNDGQIGYEVIDIYQSIRKICSF